jgi:hypothetical protein
MVYLLKMVMFHSYVKLPEGNYKIGASYLHNGVKGQFMRVSQEIGGTMGYVDIVL